ncbi:MAG: hypothetical protein IPK60_01780 [Sandaracinaceae bacterium]|nr:hypothetical protein [Sandaracinaceae bacterium]
MSSFHAFAVHLPMGLSIFAPLLFGMLAWLVGWRGVDARAWWIAVLVAWVVMGGAFVASSSGEEEREGLRQGIAAAPLDAHESAADRFTLATCALALLTLVAQVMRDQRRRRLLYVASVILAFAVAAAALRTGQLGGALVYEHGATSFRPTH